MFAAAYFSVRYFSPRYWPPVALIPFAAATATMVANAPPAGLVQELVYVTISGMSASEDAVVSSIERPDDIKSGASPVDAIQADVEEA